MKNNQITIQSNKINNYKVYLVENKDGILTEKTDLMYTINSSNIMKALVITLIREGIQHTSKVRYDQEIPDDFVIIELIEKRSSGQNRIIIYDERMELQ